ncbi:hypothetical protein BDP27DRAFT_453449 [Rhodocollybia butyracea]|uniref:F-box domain-containing protein n=1 Tax=Rhodocollybia butyracea TaxID=206335 RepID=A0A9P5TXR2_9AGAR|nr:hypothetical protein BDP27DRAFT_453449 [Rhodocollybia butyracea]
MSSFLVELPDDVLFNIVKFLELPDIFSARTTCKVFQAITMDRHIWTEMYKRSNDDFLPVVELPSQTVGDLERLLLRSHRLNTTLWINHATAKALFTQSRSLDIRNCTDLGLYKGRFLVLRHPKNAIRIYDLQATKHSEIFRYNAVEGEELEIVYNRSQSDLINDSFFLVFKTLHKCTILGISPSGVITLCKLPDFGCEISLNSIFMSNEYVIAETSNRAKVLVASLISKKVFTIFSVCRFHSHFIIDNRSHSGSTPGFLSLYCNLLAGRIRFYPLFAK